MGDGPSTMNDPPSSLVHRPLLLLTAVGLLFCAYGLMWGLPNLFDFAQDSVVPMGTLAQISAPFKDVTALRYPPFHFMLLRLCFLPARAALWAFNLGENPKVASTLFILSARLVSVAMALGAAALLYAIGRRLWDARAGFAAALIFIFSPVTLYYAKNANLDIPYIFWLAATLFFFVRIMQDERRADFLWLGISSALAVCTKDQAYGFLLPIPVMLFLHIRGKPQALRSLASGALGFVIPFALIHNLLLDWDGFRRHVQVVIGPGSEGWRQISSGLIGQLRLLVETALRLADAWTLAGVALAVLGLIAAFRETDRRVRLATIVPIITYYVAFIAVIGYVYPRFLLPMVLVLALFAGRGAAGLWLRGIAGKIAAAALIAWVGVAGLCVDYAMSNYARYDAQKWLETHADSKTEIRYVCEEGDMRDMPRFNEPLNPHPVEPTAEAIRKCDPPADLLVLSFQHDHPASGARSFRLSTILRRHLGDWGLMHGADEEKGFLERLVAGEFGYTEVVRFESPISAWVPEVSESLDRTIVILGRKNP